ncbi:hypothetical protein BDW02DRAFT_648735 [Decorospora gaudefroyi]|uniref:Uncharacterized protein n=1 Tax=Decorospora gaudefroyi TaxID=184978 RepID=A0A6A5KDC0_9PLEO|nr:hypothetical protein BDW02DRAFT_648735 [Decorospora gaudefroyi]
MDNTPKKYVCPSTEKNETLQAPTGPENAIVITENPIHPSTSPNTPSKHPPKPSNQESAQNHSDCRLATFLIFALVSLIFHVIRQKPVNPIPENMLLHLCTTTECRDWDDFFDLITEYPTKIFTVSIILDPLQHGPGSRVWPSKPYITALNSLNARSNVRTLAYVDTACETRDVGHEIDVYAGLANISADMRVQGVLLGRTLYRGEERVGEYLRNVTDAGLMVKGTNGVVLFQSAFADKPARQRLHDMLAPLGWRRDGFGMLVDSVPEDTKRMGLRTIVEGVRRDVGWLIVAHPALIFYIIINPNSGPGAAPWWPNPDYVREIPRLNALPNVTTLGYVRATYCKRSLQDVGNDIKTYAARQRGLGIDGIFVDETVNLFSEEAKAYLDAVDRKAMQCDSIGCVVHNPGTAVHTELAKPGPDITVVAETSYAHFATKEYQQWLAKSPYNWERAAYMVHSVPEDEVESLTRVLKKRAGYLFVTSESCDFYGSFARSWQTFLAVMAEA